MYDCKKRLKLLRNVIMGDKVPLPLIVLGSLCNRLSICFSLSFVS